MMFSGLMSRWTTPTACAASSAQQVDDFVIANLLAAFKDRERATVGDQVGKLHVVQKFIFGLIVSQQRPDFVKQSIIALAGFSQEPFAVLPAFCQGFMKQRFNSRPACLCHVLSPAFISRRSQVFAMLQSRITVLAEMLRISAVC